MTSGHSWLSRRALARYAQTFSATSRSDCRQTETRGRLPGNIEREWIMTTIRKALIGTLLGASALAFTAASASAAIVCTGNTCWHVKERYQYPPSANVIIHEDSWKAGPTIKFREHEGRGYWSGDRWTEW
jgi:hypothetical protein